MKKLVLNVAPFLFAGFLVISCDKNKCHECHYDKNGSEVELGEKCGQELKDLEALGTFTDSTGNYVVHCDEH